jgi:ABC-type Mn2+/Zn2+ transport system ATPase subunit
MSRAVRIREVSFGWPGQPPALDRVSLDIDVGERLAIIGPNGGGKSTLLRLILGELTPDAGEIEVLGMTPAQARRTGAIGYLPQHSGANRAFPFSVRQVVTMAVTVGLAPWQRIADEARDRVEAALARTDLLDLAHRPVQALSGGQFQRTLLARALALDPSILILDEPTTGLDASAQEKLRQVLAGLSGITLLMVTHDIRALAAPAGDAPSGSFCDRVACLRQTLHFHAAPEGVTPQVLAHVFEHDLASVFGSVKVVAESR